MKILKAIYFLAASIPALGIWPLWFMGSWKLMIVFLLLAIPIYMQQIFSEHTGRKRLYFSIAGLFLYLPLIIYAFARLYEKYGLIYKGEVVHSFPDSLYFSFVTWTTLGYGDFQPEPSLRLWAASEAMVGYVGMALLIAGIFSALKLRGQ